MSDIYFETGETSDWIDMYTYALFLYYSGMTSPVLLKTTGMIHLKNLAA
jgi:hypothetical protein